MGKTEFEEMQRINKARFEQAEERFAAEKQRRQLKRNKKRRKQIGKGKRIVLSDDSEDDVPLAQQKRATQTKTQPHEASEPKDESATGSFDSLFVDSQEPLSPPPRSSPPQRSSPHARKPPVYQSSSEESSPSSDADNSEDFPLGRRQERDSEVTVERAKHKQLDPSLSKDERETNLHAKGSAKTTSTTPKTASRADNTNEKRSPHKSRSATQTTVPTQRKASDLAGNTVPKSNAKGALTGVGKATTTAASRSSTIKSSVAGPNPSRSGIKIVNQSTTQTRREWHNSDRQYSRLRFRSLAEKKSRAEAAPDFNALEIVNGPLVATTRPQIPAANDNPYGLREIANRRVREADPDDDLRGSTDVSAPLERWEETKIPLVCPRWRLSNNCMHGSVKCRFLHRHKDAFGRDIKVGPADGSVPAKYRNPPLTCPFWLESEYGCKKPADECSFAHENTGWRPSLENRPGEPLRIDLDQVPVSIQNTHKNAHSNKGKRKNSSNQLTCWYWKHGGCHYTSESCAYQHADTGTLADPPPSAIPCRDWQNGTCPYPADKCRHSHGRTDASLGFPSKKHSASDLLIMLQGYSLPCLDSPIAIPIQRRRSSNFEQTPVADFGPAVDFEMTDSAANVLADNLNPTNTQRTSPLPLAAPPPKTGQSMEKAIPRPHQHSQPVEQPPVGMSCLRLKQKIEQACKLDFIEMFTSNRNGNALVERRAFLLYHPEDHAEELDLLTRWLLMHHVEVGNAWYDGSWDHFKQSIMRGGTGVIIAHPGFEYFSDLPDFGQVLKSDVRLWSIGLQAALEYDLAISELPHELQYDRIEIFPLGGFIYITDEVFEKKPRLALKIVELFFAKIRKLQQIAGPITPWHEVDDAAVLWRLCVRPELMQHLWQTCERHDAELQAGHAGHLSRAKLYELLNKTNWIEQDEPFVRLSMVHDKYPILSERRDIAKQEPVDYFNTLARSQEMANLRMIQYYVGLLIDMRRDYRHFYVVHTEPSAPYVRTWKTIQNIANVMTPEQLIEELRKPGKVSKIDFYEWAMPEYEVKNWKKLPVKGVKKSTA